MRVVLISNDVTPEMIVPGSAPGLRVSGIAQGLRAHGIETVVVIPRGRYEQVWSEMGTSGLPPVPPGTVVLARQHFADFLDQERPDATIICNSNQFDAIDGAATGHLVYDFFAPKMLEAECEGATREVLQALERRKLRALASADAVIVNGKKKIDYVEGQLAKCGRDDLRNRMAVVNMCYDWPEKRGVPSRTEGLSVVVSGHLQRWLNYGTMFDRLVEALETIPTLSLTLNLLRVSEDHLAANPTIRKCLGHPRTRVRGAMLFGDYADMIQEHDVFLDVFEPTEERKLAMVTRSVTALGLGVPVIHPGFTEVSPFLKQMSAGWIADITSGGEDLIALLNRLAADPDEVLAKTEGAQSLSQGAFAPKTATAPLVDMLRAA